jgi:hypothetical protein
LTSLVTLIGTATQPIEDASCFLAHTLPIFVTSFPASAIVSDSTVEFPNVESLFDPSADVPPGFARSYVNGSIDAGADYLAIDYANAGFGRFATGFKNNLVFTFSAPIALQITDVLIDPSTTLGLTPERVTFDGNELTVNFRGLFYNRNSFVRLNLTTVAASEPDDSTVPDSGRAAVPEPSSVLTLGILALAGSILKQRTKRKALQ